MMKSIAFAAALAIVPASVYAQSIGPLIRDPAGGAIRDRRSLATAHMARMARMASTASAR